jgi:hypothetical protein
MGTPFNESPCSDENERHGVFMSVGSACNMPVNQEKVIRRK